MIDEDRLANGRVGLALLTRGPMRELFLIRSDDRKPLDGPPVPPA